MPGWGVMMLTDISKKIGQGRMTVSDVGIQGIGPEIVVSQTMIVTLEIG
jgi:hypothetical protein